MSIFESAHHFLPLEQKVTLHMIQELGASHPHPCLPPAKRQRKQSAGGGRALRPGARMVAAGVLPLVMALTCSGVALTCSGVALTCSGVSNAAVTVVSSPDQPGVTSPSQPGTTAPPPPPPAAPAPAVDQQDSPAVRNNEPTRPEPQWAPAAPVVVPELHLPRPVPPVAPIQPPPNMIRIGDFQTPTPPWVPPNVRDQINTVAANGEAGVAHFWDSIGFPPSRSDRTAAATVVGAAAGVVAAGVPTAAVGAVVGGLIGGTIGGVAGAALGTVVPVPVVGTVTSGVAGTAIGAAAGAAIGAGLLGLPAAVGGGIAGGAVGAAVGVGQR